MQSTSISKNLLKRLVTLRICSVYFEKADLVIVWLGQPCCSSGRLFDAIRLVDDKNSQVLVQDHDDCLKDSEDLASALNTHLASA
jgi:hypothetical protein